MISKYSNTIIWSMTGVVIVLFWISLRSETYQTEFTAAAISVWLLSFLLNRRFKSEKKE
ncbi:MAG: hypothetical protein ACI8QD_000631 [Cyclobacteriaceae bacterium]|jgi:hypothetical protein